MRLNKDRLYIFNGGNFIQLNTDFLKEDITDGRKKIKNESKFIDTFVQGLHAHLSWFIHDQAPLLSHKDKNTSQILIQLS